MKFSQRCDIVSKDKPDGVWQIANNTELSAKRYAKIAHFVLSAPLQWIVIYLVDRVIKPLNNWAQKSFLREKTLLLWANYNFEVSVITTCTCTSSNDLF